MPGELFESDEGPNGDFLNMCSLLLVLVVVVENGETLVKWSSLLVPVDVELNGVSAPGDENGLAKGLALFLKCSARSPVGM
jgi:hypothetical protein